MAIGGDFSIAGDSGGRQKQSSVKDGPMSRLKRWFIGVFLCLGSVSILAHVIEYMTDPAGGMLLFRKSNLPDLPGMDLSNPAGQLTYKEYVILRKPFRIHGVCERVHDKSGIPEVAVELQLYKYKMVQASANGVWRGEVYRTTTDQEGKWEFRLPKKMGAVRVGIEVRHPRSTLGGRELTGAIATMLGMGENELNTNFGINDNAAPVPPAIPGPHAGG